MPSMKVDLPPKANWDAKPWQHIEKYLGTARTRKSRGNKSKGAVRNGIVSPCKKRKTLQNMAAKSYKAWKDLLRKFQKKSTLRFPLADSDPVWELCSYPAPHPAPPQWASPTQIVCQAKHLRSQPELISLLWGYMNTHSVGLLSSITKHVRSILFDYCLNQLGFRFLN